MYKTTLMAGIFALSTTAAFAAVVDFENEDLSVIDPKDVGMSYTNGAITFTSTEMMQLVGVGAPTSGFVPDDMPVGASFGDVFLTGDFNDNTDMTLTFGGQLKSIMFDIADIDGGNNDNNPNESNDEVFTFSFLLNGAAVSTEIVTANDVAGDGTVETISYTGLFDKVTITGTTTGGTRNIGWGIDNIEIAPVPLPAAGLMLLSALGGIGLMRRQKRTS